MCILLGNCSVGEARLTNGPTPNEGHMEICTVNRTWGTVCDYSFTCPNAQVACRQLGYTDPVGRYNNYAIQKEVFDYTLFRILIKCLS